MVYGWLARAFDERCPACDGWTLAGFCATCARGFARVRDPCARCGLALPVGACPRRTAAWSIESVIAPFEYTAPLDHYVQAFKYRGERALGRALALLVAPAVSTFGPRPDALVAVPLHRSRMLERGYNQAHELATQLGRELRLPVLSRGLERRSKGVSQTRRGREARRSSVAGAFVVTRRLAARHVAIVDDVITTGATVNALAAALRGAGAASCVAWAVARTRESSAKRVIEHDAGKDGGA
jgi:ComF family protein